MRLTLNHFSTEKDQIPTGYSLAGVIYPSNGQAYLSILEVKCEPVTIHKILIPKELKLNTLELQQDFIRKSMSGLLNEDVDLDIVY